MPIKNIYMHNNKKNLLPTKSTNPASRNEQTKGTTELLTNNFACCLKSQFHNSLIMVRSSQMEDRKDVLPSRLDAGCLGVDHLRHTSHNHVTNGR